MNGVKSSYFRLFDVTMKNYMYSSNNFITTRKHKVNLLRKIVNNFNPKFIEVGSICSSKKYQNALDSEIVFFHALDMITSSDKYSFTPFLHVQPTINNLEKALQIGCDSITIPSSISEAFQNKTENKTLDDTHELIVKQARKMPFNNIKVNLSCVNYCPVTRQSISADKIANEVARYIFYQEVTQVCLSDTSGTLTDDDLIAIMTLLKRLLIQPNKIGLHLLAGPTLVDQERIAKLLGVAKLAGIKWIDVSLTSGRGFSGSMKKGEIGNLRYSDIYEGIEYSEKRYGDLLFSRRLLPFCQAV